jgi:hypothetical protein
MTIMVMNSSKRKRICRGVARGGLTLIALLVLEAGIRLALINMTTTAQSSYFSERWMKSVAGEINRFGFWSHTGMGSFFLHISGH